MYVLGCSDSVHVDNACIIRNLPSNLCLPLQDMFCLYTPGGGGYGPAEEETNGAPANKRRRPNEAFAERGSVFEYRMAQEAV